MNIFFLDIEPGICAQQHCDRHVVKMITEYSQLLSTAYRLRHPGSHLPNLYPITHPHHPMVKWLLVNTAHRDYLRRLLVGLISEYDFRYGKPNTFEKARIIVKTDYIITWSRCDLIDWSLAPKCLPNCCKWKEDIFDCYRNYYIFHKKHFTVWTKREIPSWHPSSPLFYSTDAPRKFANVGECSL